jgi:hypothetical protein
MVILTIRACQLLWKFSYWLPEFSEGLIFFIEESKHGSYVCKSYITNIYFLKNLMSTDQCKKASLPFLIRICFSWGG